MDKLPLFILYNKAHATVVTTYWGVRLTAAAANPTEIIPMPRILIEASEAYRNATGIGRYSRALIAHLPPNMDVHFSPPDYATRTHHGGQRITNFLEHISLTQWAVTRQALRLRPNLIHSLSFHLPLAIPHIPQVATVFDLAYFDLPHLTDPYWGAYARRTFPYMLARADAVIVPSDFTRQRLIARFNFPEERIYVVGGAVSQDFHPVDDPEQVAAVRTRYRLNRPYVFAVNAWGGTKNLSALLAAMRGIPDLDLIVTGQPHQRAGQQHIAAQQIGVRLRAIGHVDDESLNILYQQAAVVVIPSLYEGFGLPVLEAMAAGAPVIISDAPALQATADNAALIFPAHDPAVLRQHILSVYHNPSQAEALRQQGLAHVQRLSWRDVAARVTDVWNILLYS